MLLEVPANVKIDGRDIIGNIRGNFPNKTQCRIKFDVWVNDVKHSVDILAMSIRYSFTLLGITVTLIGKEQERDIPFNLTCEYKFAKKVTCITGLAGNQQINRILNHKEIPLALAEIGKLFIS